MSEDIAGLYLVGAGTHPGAGIPGVLLSARITSDLVARRWRTRWSRHARARASAGELNAASAGVCLRLPVGGRFLPARHDPPQRHPGAPARADRREPGDLKRVLEFNVEHQVRMFRLSSDLVPFGSHPVNTMEWWDEFAEPLTEIGDFIRRHGLRVSMHPGQYTVLSSPDPRIVEAARADLVFHVRLLDALGLDPRHKIVIHVGGAYADKPAALARWRAAVADLPDQVRARLVLENDERLFGAEDVLAASAATRVPVVLDVLHHRVSPVPAPTRLCRSSSAAPPAPGIRRATAHRRSTTPPSRPACVPVRTPSTSTRPSSRAFWTSRRADVEFDCMFEAKAQRPGALPRARALGISA